MDGKGSMRDIYIACCYALVPMILFMVPASLLSHFLVQEELPLLAFFSGIGTVWSLALVFFGTMTIHDYSFGKNILVTALTIVGIGLILFLLMIFFSLTGRMVALVDNVVKEITFRS